MQTKQAILTALDRLDDPARGGGLIACGRVRHVAECDGHVRIDADPAELTGEARTRLAEQIEQAARSVGAVQGVQVDWKAQAGRGGGSGGATAGGQAASGPAKAASGAAAPEGGPASNPLPEIGHIIAVGAGKGGVGKSTVAVNLAVGLARQGSAVALLDGDIYGPSLPTMLGLDRFQPQVAGKMIMPFEVHGVRAMSLGSLVEAEKPLIWRGPMAHGAFRQIATQTAWGERDYLIIDLPPGTGDVPLTMSQLLPLSGAVVVCTPQKVAQDDARRAVRMFQQLNIEVLGVVENMSYFIGDDGKEYDIFGRGGAERMAQQMGVPYLGGVPINMALRANCDAGNPTANFETDDALARDLERVVQSLVAQVRLVSSSERAGQPSLTVR